MTYYTSEIDNFALPLPLAQQSLRVAQRFANQQPNPEKAEQVRLNTLAVHIVHNYLQMMGVATDLAASDSWNPIMQLCADVADLYLPNVGKLECRPVRSLSTCPVPPEAWADRIGYVMVHIDEEQQQAHLLGFVKSVEEEEIPFSQLQAPEEMLEEIDRLLHPASQLETVGLLERTAIATQTTLQSTSQTLVNLSQWFQDIFTEGWQSLDAVLSPQDSPALAFRSTTETPELTTEIQRAKILDLGAIGGQIALIVALNSLTNQEIEIILQLRPLSDRFLPPDLKLVISDDVGDPFLEAISTSSDTILQLQFSLLKGGNNTSFFQRFDIQIHAGDDIFTENFVA
jgi:Protein of unknown function (DUF1822)